MNGLLRFSKVTLTRGGRRLFEGLDLALPAGGALLVTGPNGSGKSSLIRLAAGLLRADSGSIERSALALADEHLALDRELPLAMALRFWAGLQGTGDKLTAAMDSLGLAPLAEVPVRLLSTGQAKRARLARVAMSSAPLWLLDEPLNGLDRGGMEQLDRLIADHRSSGGAVLAASHVPMTGEWARLELAA